MYEKCNSKWGLALTYNLIGKIYSFTVMDELKKAEENFLKATKLFGEINHYRGVFQTLKEIYDLKHNSKLVALYQNEARTKQQAKFYASL